MKKSDGVHSVKVEGALNAVTFTISAIAFLSVISQIGIIFSASFIAIFAAALYFDYRKRYSIYRTPLNIALIVFIGVNSLRISLDNFAVPLVETILILLAVKLIEEKKPRDYLQIYTLAVFLLTGSALLTLDVQFLLILALLAFLLPVSIVLLTFHSQQGGMMITNIDLRNIVSRALMLALVSIPVAAFMFVILPRSGFPILNIMSKPSATTGFSDLVKLGDISDIQESGAVMMRVESERIDPSMLYWRGVVLDYFDGTSWKSRGMESSQPAFTGLSGKRVSQVIYLEPYDNRYLFALDKPVNVYFRNAVMSADLTIAARRNIDKLVRYSVISVLTDTYARQVIERKRYLQLPERDYSRVKTLVKGLTSGREGEAAARSILQYLKKGSFSYAIRNLPITENPVEDFLFVYKYGNCEYFASSMAVMLRLSGIPARLVGGYLGGQYNDFGRYYLVTQNTAHVWVEAHIQGKGWVRMDPTPEGAVLANLEGKGLLWKLKLFFDFINYYWNSMIIDYDFEKQISLFAGVRNTLRSPFHASMALDKLMPGAAYAGAALVLLAISVYALIKRKSVEKRVINRFVKKMKKRGYIRLPYEGLEEFAGRVDDPEIREKALTVALAFEGIYYRDKKMTRLERMSLYSLVKDI